MIMKYTENYKLKMPEGNDYVSVDDFNDNFESVDKELALQRSDFTEFLNGETPITGNTLGIGDGYVEVFGGENNLGLSTKNEKDNNQNKRSLTLANSKLKSKVSEALWFNDKVNGTDTTYQIFGQHNKPHGSYTGNGSTESRTINIGGIGNCLVITSGAFLVFVNKSGGLCVVPGQKIESFDATVMKFDNGALTLATSSAYVNKSGSTYLYDLI